MKNLKLEEFYTANPIWEQRRFELVKEFAVAYYKRRLVDNKSSHSFGIQSDYVAMADSLLSELNPTIKDLLNSEDDNK